MWKKVLFWVQKSSIFRWKSISKPYAKSVKNIIIFILCWKCIIWCWWAWRVYGNVSGVLQTRKTTKNHAPFLRIYYNRNPNTNGHLLPFFILGYSGAPSEPCTRNDRAPREIKIVPNREKKAVVVDIISLAVSFYNVFQITKQSNCHREMCKYFNEMSK